jgi:hypothetical protein
MCAGESECPGCWVVAFHEVVEVAALKGIFLESKMHVRVQVINPELLRPRLFLCGLAVEEQDVRLHTLRIKDAGGETQQSVQGKDSQTCLINHLEM